MNFCAPAPAYLSATDTEVFGIRIARANILSPADIAAAQSFCRSERVRLIIARCPTSSPELIHALTKAGYLLMDTLVYYTCSVKKLLGNAYATAIAVRHACADDATLVADLARDSFRDCPSHYHADPRLDRAKCAEVYAYWAASSCRKGDANEAVLVAEDGGRPVGFGIARITPEGMGDAVLAGVHPSCGRSGAHVFRALLYEGTRFVYAKGARRAFTSTQLSNVVMLRLWTEAGWVPTDSVHTLHKWIDE